MVISHTLILLLPSLPSFFTFQRRWIHMKHTFTILMILWIFVFTKDTSLRGELFEIEMFYFNTIEQFFLFVMQLDQLEVCLPYRGLLADIPILVVFQNLRWNSNKTYFYRWNLNKSILVYYFSGNINITNRVEATKLYFTFLSCLCF